MTLPATTPRAAARCRIAACAPTTPVTAGGRPRELSFALLAEQGMGVHHGLGMNAVGAPPGARVAAASERENTLLSFGRAAEHAVVAFIEFDIQIVRSHPLLRLHLLVAASPFYSSRPKRIANLAVLINVPATTREKTRELLTSYMLDWVEKRKARELLSSKH